MKGPDGKAELAKRRRREGVCRTRTNSKTKPVRNTSRRPKTGVGLGDAESAEEGLALILGRGSACKDFLVREQRHPARTAVDAQVIGRDPAGNSESEPMLNHLPRRKLELERCAPIRMVDGKTAAAAGGERKGKAEMENGLDLLHGG